MWTLENIFYLLGIIFLVVTLLTMLITAVGIWVAVGRAKQLKARLEAQLAEKERSSAGQVFKAIFPLLLTLGLKGGYKTILKKVRR